MLLFLLLLLQLLLLPLLVLQSYAFSKQTVINNLKHVKFVTSIPLVFYFFVRKFPICHACFISLGSILVYHILCKLITKTC